MGKKKRNLAKTVTWMVVFGFAALYLMIIGLATYLTAMKFAQEDDKLLLQKTSDMQRKIDAKEEEKYSEGWEEMERQVWYQNCVNDILWTEEKFKQFSSAVYDEKGTLMAKSRSTLGGNRTVSTDSSKQYMIFALDQLLSPEEEALLAEYRWENIQSFEELLPPSYRICIQTSEDRKQLLKIFVQHITWTKADEAGEETIDDYEDPLLNTHYSLEISFPILYHRVEYWDDEKTEEWYETDSKVIWEWSADETENTDDTAEKIMETSEIFPYIHMGIKSWEEWRKNQYLYEFPEEIEGSQWGYRGESQRDSDHHFLKMMDSRKALEFSVESWEDGETVCYIEVRMQSHPWLAALDYMKYVYLAGFMLMLVCMLTLIYSANKIYSQQEALEETRRDFINSMAHELKTPLGIIRNFAENLQERNMEEKREYYLSQIIGQTKEMDALVVEMIMVIKMDSVNLVLQKEIVSINTLIQEQISRFKLMIDEQHIQVQIQNEQDFLVEGDSAYLGKAIWNLLSNAVVYNVPGGKILVKIKENQCSIENTAQSLTREQLNHVFDLFYSKDKSRSSEGRHMGMGLFLAKKIAERHYLEITLENTEIGVRVKLFCRDS